GRVLSRGATPQPMNGACRQLVAKGLLVRAPRPDGQIVNRLSASTPVPDAITPVAAVLPPIAGITEDDLKRLLEKHLQAKGWTTDTKMGKLRGIDIEASRGSDRWIIEAKGHGGYDQMQGSYFLAVLGELLQRMSQ